MQSAVEIDVRLIDAAPTARPVLPGAVMALAESIKQIGLLQPISVRAKGDRYELIVGGHRLEAVKVLGWATVPAFLRTDDDLHAELALIDENLIRNELSPAERAMAMGRRKKIYEALHPQTAHGAAPKPKGQKSGKGKSRQLGDISPKAERFSKATADATGTSERAVQRDTHRCETLAPDVLAKVVGTKLDTGEQLDALTKLKPEQAAELVEKAAAGEKVNAVAAVSAATRSQREQDLADKTRALPDTKVNVIYADPPWRTEVHDEDSGHDRSPEAHYPTMTLGQILNLDVKRIAADDCILFLWTTPHHFVDALYVMEEWGFLTFRPRAADGKLLRGDDGELVGCPGADHRPTSAPRFSTQGIWHKDRLGMGRWFRNKHEHLIIGLRGKIPAPTPGTQCESVMTAAVRDHSRKPLIFRAMIERLFPNLPKLELFARTPAPGWVQWGKEAPSPLPEVEEGLDGKEIIAKTPAEKREAKLMEDAMAEASGEQLPGHIKLPNVDSDDIPQFLKDVRRPQSQRVG